MAKDDKNEPSDGSVKETSADSSIAVPATYVNRMQLFTSKDGTVLRLGFGESSPAKSVFHVAIAMSSKDARRLARLITSTLDKKEESLKEEAKKAEEGNDASGSGN